VTPTLCATEPLLVTLMDPPLGTVTVEGEMANSLRATATGAVEADPEPPPSGLVAATTPTMIRAKIEVTTAKRESIVWLAGDTRLLLEWVVGYDTARERGWPRHRNSLLWVWHRQ
jgi:hypothetical protein